MATTQLGGVAVTPAEQRPRQHPQRPPTTSSPGQVLDALLRNLKPRQGRRGLANELADHLGVSKQTIHNWRIGRIALPLDRAKTSAEFLGVDPALFFGTHQDALRWIIDHRHADIPCNRD